MDLLTEWLVKAGALVLGILAIYFGAKSKINEKKVAKLEAESIQRGQAEAAHIAAAKTRLEDVIDRAKDTKAPDVKNRTDFEDLK